MMKLSTLVTTSNSPQERPANLELKSLLIRTGTMPGRNIQRQFYGHTHIGSMSSPIMGSTSSGSSWQDLTPITMLSMTKPLENSFMGTRNSLLPIPISSQTSPIKSSYLANTKGEPGGVTAMLPALAKVAGKGDIRESKLEALWSFPFAENSIRQQVVNDSTVNSSTNAHIVHQAATPNLTALAKRKRVLVNDLESRGKRPQYMWFIFGKSDFGCTPSATYTESAAAVPSVPLSDYRYTDMTISMSCEAKQKLIESIWDFVLNTPDNKCQHPL